MIELSLLVSLGLLILFAKMSWVWRIRLLSNPLKVDVAVFVLLTLLHWGTFSGVMVASIAAFFTSVLLSAGRWLFGYVKDRRYYRGALDMYERIA